MNAGFGEVDGQIAQVLGGRKAESPGETFITRKAICLEVPHERAEQGAGIQCQAHPLIVCAVGRLRFLAAALGNHVVGGLDHDCHDPGGFAIVVGHRAVIEVHPDVFGDAIAQQHQLLAVIGQGTAGQAGIDHVAVELGDLRPAQLNRGAQQIRMTPTGKDRIGVVVDHVPLMPPQHDNRYRRGQQHLHGAAQAGGPGLEWPQLGVAPVERANPRGHFTPPPLTPMAIV
ncbi:hypothetical protein D3C73_947880 [compost metagenome]